MPQLHHRVCHLCEAMCGLVIEHENGVIRSIRGDQKDPLSRGHLCPKAYGLKDVHEDPDRLRTPLRRVGDRWEPAGWDEALDEVAHRISTIQQRHGASSVALYQGNPTVHNYSGALFGQLFQKALGSRNRFSATSIDQLPHMLAALQMFGHQLLLPIPDIDRTDFFLIVGANPLVSNGSLMSAPDVRHRIEAIRARGGRVVVIDPRRTETAQLADLHLPVRPGTDALLLASLLHVLFAEGLARPGRLAPFTAGLPELQRAVAPFSPEEVAPHVGLDAPRLRSLARDIAAAPSAALYGRIGVSTQTFGGLASWMLYALSVVTGNLDRPGGSMFTSPAFDIVRFASKIGQRGHFDKGRSRVRKLPEFGGEYPVSTLAEEIETPGQGQIRGLVTMAGNPVLSSPNGRRLDRALASLDFMVSIDIYRNETTRHAHFILPTTFGVEHDHYDVIFHALAIRNTARYSLPLFSPHPQARHDWEIFLDLATRLQAARGPAHALAARAQRRALRALSPAGLVDLGLRLGPYGKSLQMSLATLKQAPHGVDLGPLRPLLPGRLETRDRKIDVAPRLFLNDLPRLQRLLTEAPAEGLTLIGRRELRSNNSWMHNSERLTRGPERCTLRMHPEDARRRGLQDGCRVQLTTRVGSIEATLELTDEMRPGVVSLPHGWGHDRPGAALRVASARPGVSLNDVTDDLALDPLSGVAAFNGLPVQIAAVP
ncbi:MAG: molybdopterin oxidoreductase family protein [Polyangiaceae bacterium]|nr:molybdopterin oxidoreductase family protein [Polyangiaceae bacterium]